MPRLRFSPPRFIISMLPPLLLLRQFSDAMPLFAVVAFSFSMPLMFFTMPHYAIISAAFRLPRRLYMLFDIARDIAFDYSLFR